MNLWKIIYKIDCIIIDLEYIYIYYKKSNYLVKKINDKNVNRVLWLIFYKELIYKVL